MFKKITSAVMAVAMVAAMSVSVFADSANRNITNFSVSSSNSYTEAGRKETATSIYSKITSVTGSVQSVIVNAYGADSTGALLDGRIECNYGGTDRIINVGKATMIRNTVNENSKLYARLAFKRNGSSNYSITGVWSPDSVPESGSVTI